MAFMTKGEATSERNLLSVYEILYPRAVASVATALRPRFESGELRGWMSADADLPLRRRDPQTKIADECSRRFVTTPARALGVLAVSPMVSANDADGYQLVEAWRFDRCGGQTLSGAASVAMALDVLLFAREQGWSKPRKGEEPLNWSRKARRDARAGARYTAQRRAA